MLVTNALPLVSAKMPLSQPETMGVLFGSPSPFTPQAVSWPRLPPIDFRSQDHNAYHGRQAGPDLVPPNSFLAMPT